MKRIISMLLAVVLILSLLPVAVFADDLPIVTLEVDKTTVLKGETVTLTMKLNADVSGTVNAWQWNFVWDSTYFEPTASAIGDATQPLVSGVPALVVTPIVNYANPSSYYASPYACATVTSGTGTTAHYLKAGTIATLTLTAKQDITEEAATKLFLDGVKVIDDKGTALNVVTTEAQYEWGTSSQTVPSEDKGYSVTVAPAPSTVAVTGVELDQETLSLTVGGSATLSATVAPKDATNKAVTWSAAPAEGEGTACVTVDNGIVTANSVGTAVITVTTEDGRFTDSCTVTVTAAEPAPTEDVYTVSMKDADPVTVGEKAYIDVTVGHTGDATTYNAFDMTFQYDTDVLTLVQPTGDMTVVDNNGTVHVERYGTDMTVDEVAFTLEFTAKETGTADVTLQEAYVGVSDTALNKDADKAQIPTAPAVVTVTGYKVTFETTDFEGKGVVEPGASYTFEAKDKNYNYDFTGSTMGGEDVTIEDNGDGTFTVASVTGNLVIKTTKSGKTFNVTIEGTGAADMAPNTGFEVGEGKAKYQNKEGYQAVLTPQNGYTYDVAIKIGGDDYTAQVDGNVYTIAGEDITGHIVITVTKTAETPTTTHNVKFEGNGAGDVAEGTATTVADGATYSFNLIQADGFEYTVTATMGGSGVDVDYEKTTAEDDTVTHTYSIENVTGDLVITISKSDLQVTVHTYLDLDEKTMYLVCATQTLEEGKALSYADSTMFFRNYTDETNQDCWQYLVIVEKAPEGEEQVVYDAAAAKAEIKVVEAAVTALETTCDVNETGKVDINDAQLVFDMYNKKYPVFKVETTEQSETQVQSATMEQFLKADVNESKNLEVGDTTNIVSAIIAAKTPAASETN